MSAARLHCSLLTDRHELVCDCRKRKVSHDVNNKGVNKISRNTFFGEWPYLRFFLVEGAFWQLQLFTLGKHGLELECRVRKDPFQLSMKMFVNKLPDLVRYDSVLVDSYE